MAEINHQGGSSMSVPLDYAHRSEADIARIREIVERQLEAMAPEHRDEMNKLIEKVQERQRRAPREGVPFDLLGDKWESGEAVASGQLVVPVPDGKSVADVKKILEGEHFVDAPRRNNVKRPESRVLTVFRAGRTVDDLKSDVRSLARKGITASFNPVLPLGQHTIKGGNLPMPAPGDPPPPPSPPATVAQNDRVRIAIVDTGIGPKRTDGWLDIVPRDDENAELLDVLPLANHLDFDQGHGTFVAGIVQRIAPGCEIRSYRFTGADGVGTV
jgi:hypothetical protein